MRHEEKKVKLKVSTHGSTSYYGCRNCLSPTFFDLIPTFANGDIQHSLKIVIHRRIWAESILLFGCQDLSVQCNCNFFFCSLIISHSLEVSYVLIRSDVKKRLDSIILTLYNECFFFYYTKKYRVSIKIDKTEKCYFQNVSHEERFLQYVHFKLLYKLFFLIGFTILRHYIQIMTYVKFAKIGKER